MSTPVNVLQIVQTFNESTLTCLLNQNAFIATANTQFKNFPSIYSNLGSSVILDQPPLFTDGEGLVVSFQPANQRTLTLTCDQAKNVSYEFNSQELIFNVEKQGFDYLKKFAKSAAVQLGSVVEKNVALNANSSVPVYTLVSGQNVPTGALHTESGPYKFFGNGKTPINSYNQLAQAVANYKDTGSTADEFKFYLPVTAVPSIIGSGLNQFAPMRNDKIAMSWEIGEFGTPPIKYYQSNALPLHQAGTVGDSAQTLTVVSTNDATGQNITQITFSGATASDANAIKSGDMFEFNDGVGSFRNMRALTRIGQIVSGQGVQFRATANAAADGAGNVVVSIFPALQSAPGATQNMNQNILAGMQASVLPSHRAGLLVCGNSFYISMPQLPNEDPYNTSNMVDPESNVSVRTYYGSLFGRNQRGYVFDCTWGSLVAPDYCMRVAFPP